MTTSQPIPWAGYSYSCEPSKVKVSYSKERGNHILAAEDIAEGEVVLVETPYLFAPYPILVVSSSTVGPFENREEAIYTRCHWCIQPVESKKNVACPKCKTTLWCNEKCRTSDIYHSPLCEATIKTSSTSSTLTSPYLLPTLLLARGVEPNFALYPSSEPLPELDTFGGDRQSFASNSANGAEDVPRCPFDFGRMTTPDAEAVMSVRGQGGKPSLLVRTDGTPARRILSLFDCVAFRHLPVTFGYR